MNDTIVFTAFKEVYSYCADPIHRSINKSIVTLKQLEKYISKLSEHERIDFVNRQYEELTRLKEALLNRERISQFISFHDKIFISLIKLEEYENISSVSHIFKSFMLGITCFNGDDLSNKPIYHRLDSCGPRNQSLYEEWHICKDNDNPEKRSEISKRIHLCYLERLIYDDIYKKLNFFYPKRATSINRQNKGHRYRLKSTKEDYKSCFPDLDLEVSLEYEDKYPVKLQIRKLVRNRVRYIETYQRRLNHLTTGKLYSKIVECSLIKSNGKFMKVQSEDQKEESWGRKITDNKFDFDTHILR